MSRVVLEAKNESHGWCVCGIASGIGWFFMLYGNPTEEESEHVLIDEDQMFTRGFGKAKLLERIEEFAADDEITRHAINMISADLDPELGLPNSYYER